VYGCNVRVLFKGPSLRYFFDEKFFLSQGYKEIVIIQYKRNQNRKMKLTNWMREKEKIVLLKSSLQVEVSQTYM